jgi:hypothetical protein
MHKYSCNLNFMHLNLPVSFKQLVQILLFTILLIMQKKYGNMFKIDFDVKCFYVSIYLYFDRKYYFNLTILVTISDQIEVEN